MAFVCARCREPLADADAVCPRCPAARRPCRSCGAMIRHLDELCPECEAWQGPGAVREYVLRGWRARGERHLGEGQLALALRCFDRLLEARPDATAWVRKAVVLRRMGSAGEAAACLARAIELDPRSAARMSETEAAGATGPAPAPTPPPARTGGDEAAPDAHRAGLPFRPEPTAPEARWQWRHGGLWKGPSRSLLEVHGSAAMGGGSEGDDERAVDAPAPPPDPQGAAIGPLLGSADAHAERGDLERALGDVGAALAADVAAPGAIERHHRWRALAATVPRLPEALAGRADEGMRDELRRAARALEESGHLADAACAHAVLGDEASRLRLLETSGVVEALCARLEQCTGELSAGDPAGTAAVAARLAATGRRLAAIEAVRSGLRGAHEPALVGLGALVLALLVRGPRVLLELSGRPVRCVLGDRITIGREGASLLVRAPALAAQQACLRREGGGAVLEDLGNGSLTTLAGAVVAAPLPVGAGLRVELAGALPCSIAPLGPAGDTPLEVTIGGDRWLVPLGEARFGEWRLFAAGASDGSPLVLASDSARGATLEGYGGVGARVELCHGDSILFEGDPRRLRLPPPPRW